MSNQSEQEKTMTPEEVRQSLLARLEASKQAIAALSDEQLEAITGGALGGNEYRPAIQNVGLYNMIFEEGNNLGALVPPHPNPAQPNPAPHPVQPNPVPHPAQPNPAPQRPALRRSRSAHF